MWGRGESAASVAGLDALWIPNPAARCSGVFEKRSRAERAACGDVRQVGCDLTGSLSAPDRVARRAPGPHEEVMASSLRRIRR